MVGSVVGAATLGVGAAVLYSRTRPESAVRMIQLTDYGAGAGGTPSTLSARQGGTTLPGTIVEAGGDLASKV